MKPFACLAAVALAGCFRTAPRAGDVSTDHPHDTPGDEADAGADVPLPEGVCPWGWDCRVATAPAFTGLDVLFVIDDSMDMGLNQDLLLAEFPAFLSMTLDPEIDPDSGVPVHVPVKSLHLGVVSTDMGSGGHAVGTCADPVDGDDGLLLNTPSPDVAGCYPVYPTFLLYDEEGPSPAEIDDLSSAMTCIATLGTEGCGFEQPLEAGLKALTTHSMPGQPNDGFLRSDSIALVVWISSENDCSVSNPAIFDPEDPTLGPLGVRCHSYPEYLYEVTRYIGGFAGLAASRPVVLGMIVGVPPDNDRCVAEGSYLGFCLDVPEMREAVVPEDPGRLRSVCSSDRGDAYPARRFVELALAFGPRSYVGSICDGSFLPTLSILADKVSGIADASCSATHLRLEKDPLDACACVSDCRVVEVLTDSSACPSGTWEWDSDSDTLPNDVTVSGRPVSACEVPHAGTRVSDCSLPCTDPHQRFSPDGGGWYYSLSDSGLACPTISFTSAFSPLPGSTILVLCP